MVVVVIGVPCCPGAAQRVSLRVFQRTWSVCDGNIAVDVLQVVRLHWVCVVEKEGEGDGCDGDDHGGDAGVEVEPGELVCRVEGRGFNGAKDPVDDLKDIRWSVWESGI